MRSVQLVVAALAVVGSLVNVAGAVRGQAVDRAKIDPASPVFTGASGNPLEVANIVVPGGVESTATSGVNSVIRSAGRVYQEFVGASNFAASVTSPTTITGMQLRLAIGENWRPVGYVGGTWPSQPISLGTFTVTLGKPSAVLLTDGEYLSSSGAFSNYITSPVVVRTGTLSIPAGAFSADGGTTGVHSWGPVFSFSTPYTINPGEGLVMQVNHGGYTPSTELNAFFATREFANGVTDAISSTVSGTATNSNGFSSPYFVNLIVPEPTSLGLVGGLTLLMGRRRGR